MRSFSPCISMSVFHQTFSSYFTNSFSQHLPTPIRVNKLHAYLEGYPIRSKDYLINGFSNGFLLDYVGPQIASSCINLLSALLKPDAVDDKLDKELKLGRIVGPFLTRPFPLLHISPLGLIPKKTPEDTA